MARASLLSAFAVCLLVAMPAAAQNVCCEKCSGTTNMDTNQPSIYCADVAEGEEGWWDCRVWIWDTVNAHCEGIDRCRGERGSNWPSGSVSLMRIESLESRELFVNRPILRSYKARTPAARAVRMRAP